MIGVFISYIWPTSEKNESDISVSDGFKEVAENNKESFRQNANDINKDKRLAKKFEITEVIVNTSRHLTKSYHLYRPLSNLADEYEKIYRESHSLLEAEYLAETLYDDLSKHFIKIKATQRHLQAKALDYLAQLKPFCE